MAYITNSNERRVIKDMAYIVFIEPSDFNLEYKSDMALFSEYETKQLISVKELFKNYKFYVDKYYSILKSTDDRCSRYVDLGGPPAFHMFQDCEALNSDFTSYLIPPEVLGRGLDETKKFRRWFKENKKLLSKNPKSFAAQMELNFKIRNIRSIVSVTEGNTGSVEFENINLGTLEESIDVLLHAAENYRNSTPVVSKLIMDKGDKYYKKETNKFNRDILYKWHKIKQSIKKKLITYYTIKYSPDISFSGNLLEKLGFHECSTCKTNALVGNVNVAANF